MDPDQQAVPEGHSRRTGRGIFLSTLAVGVSSLAWGNAAWRGVSSWLAPLEAAVPLVPSGGWRIYTVTRAPRINRATWRLKVGGLVKRTIVLSYEELLSWPRQNFISDFHCVSGWSVERVLWSGVLLSDLLLAARPLGRARALEFVSAETPYVDYLTMPQASAHNVVLALEMDGRPLSRDHGAPVRLVVPRMYGYKSVKWLREINVVGSMRDGYWERLGYDRDAWVGRSNRPGPAIGPDGFGGG